jgi:Tat protein secretion system quality control protein TatD with DNase activity
MMLLATCGKIGAVAYVVAQVMGKPVEQVVQAAWENTVKVFFPHRKDWL